MTARPYVVVSCAMSIDGYLDDASDGRLLLSGPDDFAQVDVDRAAADAILVGANTVRRDNPRLLVRAPHLIAQRQRQGLPPSPVKVIISASGNLNPDAPFFTAGAVEKIMYVAAEHVEAARSRLGAVATVVDAGDLGMAGVLADLRARGVRRLLAEGGSSVLTQLLAADLVDELLVSIAPVFVGDSGAPRFVGDGRFPFSAGRRMRLAGVAQLGDCVRIRYLLTETGPAEPVLGEGSGDDQQR